MRWKILDRSDRPPLRGSTVCIANQKGGVGKTTTAVNLAAALALRGHRILVVDVDPQANATTGLGLDHRDVATSTYDLLLEETPLDRIVKRTAIEGLFCAPASLDLAGAEVELVGSIARERKLAEALEGAAEHYDLILLDCPPSLGLLTVNALAAAQELIVPVQCEYYALEGLGQLLGNAERVRRALNPDLRITGFLMTMYDARTKLSSQVADEVRSHFGELVFGTVIPRSVRLSEAPSFGEPVLTLDPSSRGSISYRLLSVEVESRFALENRDEPQAPPPPPPAPDRPKVQVGQPGPAGRGYGTVSVEPAGLDDAWPPARSWGEEERPVPARAGSSDDRGDRS